ncbi:hypothetical protein P168DRAFT_317427 [Aspergillus campestris IBT 28561]|uniref:Uncharacterized protein n=1 Tax=Aspergillus campestris (strain IBT 28561) TaxID=1392248 RepID=A0A2I1D7R3_ASPC2|nr:uncharacterized protein P168DRAFT_317427 [Aspergillus campestris IBT 28561]PKY05922.1 hypothetical protein P168DRAFT_317427 [Aspergillus campestris IBT 28561]
MRNSSTGSCKQQISSEAGDAGDALMGGEAHPANHASGLEKKASWFRRTLTDTWAPEITAIVSMLLCLVAILVILTEYQGRSVPDLPMGLTLNTIISILATGAKSLLIYAISASIGQSKWIWFNPGQPLQDLQTFDDASRGPLGSTTLLFGRTITSVASLGAAVTVTGLAFEPFVQQVVLYSVENVKTSSPLATANKATSFREDGAHMRSSVMSGIWATKEALQAIPSCPTQNCTWPRQRMTRSLPALSKPHSTIPASSSSNYYNARPLGTEVIWGSSSPS